MNIESLFKISYGLYIVCSGDKNHGNGFISNTVFQVTAEPIKFATCCNKDNYTCQLIEKHSSFSVSILSEDTSSDIFGTFGYKSGKDFDKLKGMTVNYGKTGSPIVLNDSIAFMEFKVIEKFDVGTHILFIGELVDAQLTDNNTAPITYAYYRNVKKGIAPKNAPTYVDKSKFADKSTISKQSQYKCSVCGYIYDDNIETIKFTDLGNDWTCPLCGVEKDDFI